MLKLSGFPPFYLVQGHSPQNRAIHNNNESLHFNGPNLEPPYRHAQRIVY